MEEKLKVVFTNNLDISVLDKDFYQLLFARIVDLQRKKEKKS
ncbi:MAG: hypothetical protein ACI4R8_03045 [Candidatus Caccovivens sp.]